MRFTLITALAATALAIPMPQGGLDATTQGLGPVAPAATPTPPTGGEGAGSSSPESSAAPEAPASPAASEIPVVSASPAASLVPAGPADPASASSSAAAAVPAGPATSAAPPSPPPAAVSSVVPLSSPATPAVPSSPVFPAPATPTASTACSTTINNLAQGIQKNIQIQQSETQVLDIISQLLNAPPAAAKNGTASAALTFAAQKARFITLIDQEIIQRQMNQFLSLSDASVSAGLNTVANQQLMELVYAGLLTGNQASDAKTLANLQLVIASNTKQNLQNLLDATEGCISGDSNVQLGISRAISLGLKAKVSRV